MHLRVQLHLQNATNLNVKNHLYINNNDNNNNNNNNSNNIFIKCNKYIL